MVGQIRHVQYNMFLENNGTVQFTVWSFEFKTMFFDDHLLIFHMVPISGKNAMFIVGVLSNGPNFGLIHLAGQYL